MFKTQASFFHNPLSLDTENDAANSKNTALDKLFSEAGILEEVNELRENYFPYCTKPEQQLILKYAEHIAKVTDEMVEVGAGTDAKKYKNLYINDDQINTVNPKEHLAFHVGIAVLSNAIGVVHNDKENDAEADQMDKDKDGNRQAVMTRAKKFVVRNYLLPRRYWCDYLQKSYRILSTQTRTTGGFLYAGRDQADILLAKNSAEIYGRPCSWGPNMWVRSMVDPEGNTEHILYYLHPDVDNLVGQIDESRKKYKKRGRGNAGDQLKLATGAEPIMMAADPLKVLDINVAASHIFYKPNSATHVSLLEQYNNDKRYRRVPTPKMEPSLKAD